jgi:hypothetical protein
MLTVGVALSLSALVLVLSASGKAVDGFYPLMDAVMVRMHGAMHVAPSNPANADRLWEESQRLLG